MQAARAAAVASILLFATTTMAGNPLPSIKYVQSDSGVLRAGPGEQFYVTQNLSWGTRVEVYQQDNGWSAIRPPEGSFSWIEASNVEMTADPSVGVISAGGVVTRVGSTEHNRRDAEYIPLDRGEMVELLGVETVRDETGAWKKWLKIAPPAGEFRWIESALLADTPVNKVASKAAVRPRMISETSHRIGSSPQPRMVTKRTIERKQPGNIRLTSMDQPLSSEPMSTEPIPAEAMPTEPTLSEQRSMPKHFDPATTFSSASPIIGSGIKTEPIRSLATSTQPSPPRCKGSVVDWTSRPEQMRKGDRAMQQLPTKGLVRDRRVAAASTFEVKQPRMASTPAPADEVLDELADLSIELSAIVTDDSSNWDLDFIRTQTQHLLAQDISRTARDRASSLLDRIDRFSDVKLRYDHLHNLTVDQRAETVNFSPADHRIADTPQNEPMTDAALLSSAQPSPPRLRAIQMLNRAVTSIGGTPQPIPVQQTSYYEPIRRNVQDPYAGSGTLMPVHSSRGDIPQFALTDENGSIQAFVSAKAGLNLGRYAGKRVGIVGDENRGNSVGSRHLLADRVVLLDRLR